MKGEDSLTHEVTAYARFPADGRKFLILIQLFRPLKEKVKGCRVTPVGEKT